MIDFKFSSIAKYIDKVSIGQRGYCYIINSKGEIIYHPQQQILFSGLKKENTDEIFDLADGIHRKRNNIYNISALYSNDSACFSNFCIESTSLLTGLVTVLERIK